jgi:hypothetical protein
MEQDGIELVGAPRPSEPTWLHPILVRAQGVVLETPRLTAPPRGTLSSFAPSGPTLAFTMQLELLTGPAETIHTPWRVRVSVPVSEPGIFDLRAGDGVRCSGHLWLNSPSLNNPIGAC